MLATVERLVPTEQLAEMGVTIPYFYVTALTEVHYGAHPTACYPFYAYDRRHTAHYYQVAGESAEAFRDHYLQPYVHDCRTHTEYLNAVGGENSLQRLAGWQQDAETWRSLYE